MSKKKILFITNEMEPYAKLGPMAQLSRDLPQYMQNKDMEVRVFMPRYGKINERRHRLHEVIRLSGINIPVGEDDNMLIIKVASLPSAKMQIYFLDNDEFFSRKAYMTDKEGKNFEDNDERVIFFNKGCIEILLKLGWVPDIIHCQGWMTGLVPFYARTVHSEEPVFKNAKIIFSVGKYDYSGNFGESFVEKAVSRDQTPEELAFLKNADPDSLLQTGLKYADAVSVLDSNLNGDVRSTFDELKNTKPALDYVDPESEEFIPSYHDFYKGIVG